MQRSEQLKRLLTPRSIAVVGASPTPGSLGASVVANLDRMQFSGPLHLINPKRDEIGGRPCLKSVDELPWGIDVAVLAIPHAAVLGTVRQLAVRGVGAAVIFSAGFAEGGVAGLAEQRELARVAHDSNMIIEGPNCLGLVNYVDRICLTFVETPALAFGPGPGVGIVSQSGAMAAVVGVTLTSREIGISYSISTGNEAESGVEDYFEYLLDDPHTSVIGLIVEQFRQPQRLLKLAATARARGKPVILLHPGRGQAARESAATHTGALAGDHQVMAAHVSRRGIKLSDSLEQFGDLLELAFRCSGRPAQGTVVLTESGAFKALTLDLCEQVGLELPVLTDATAPELRKVVPDFVPVSNPIDLTAQGLVDPDVYRRALEVLMADERFGVIILGIIQTDPKTSAAKFPTIINALQRLERRKFVVFAGLDEGAQVPQEYVRQLHALNVPYFPAAERAYRALARLLEPPPDPVDETSADLPGVALQLTSRGFIPEYLSKQLLRNIGISFPVGQLVTSLRQAQEAAASWGGAVVLKAQSAALPHKSEVGGVVLGLNGADEIAEGWHRLTDSMAGNCPELKLDGVLVEAMSKPGLELIIGGRNDAEWGASILVGFGGVHAEILKDFVLLPAGVSHAAIVAALYSLRSGILLRGFRGSPALDVGAIAQIVEQVGKVLRAHPGIHELDLNPVVVYPAGQGAVALDALILMAPVLSESGPVGH
jgi:acyl-CoA synthetase (NDP forming)